MPHFLKVPAYTEEIPSFVDLVRSCDIIAERVQELNEAGAKGLRPLVAQELNSIKQIFRARYPSIE
jgi:hypothetical protein